MKKTVQTIIAGALVVTLSLGLAGCGASGTAYVQSVGMICGVGSTAQVDRFAGVIEAKAQTEIKLDADKTVDQLFVAVGDLVEEGQPLFTYDRARVELAVTKAQLELESLKTSIQTKTAELASARTMVGRTSGTTKLSYELQVKTLEVEITEAQYAITEKEEALAKQQALLDNLEVAAPVSGLIRAINAPGSTDSNGNELPYMVITEQGDYVVKGYVNEANITSLYVGMPVLVRSRVDDTVQRGAIKSIDMNSPQQGESGYYIKDDTTSSSKYPFYVELQGSEGFIVGQHVYLEPDYGQADVSGEGLALPEYYVVDAEGNPYVWAEGASGKLEKRHITVGFYDADLGVYYVTAGLTAQDYIAFPAEDLKAGMACEEYSGYVDDGDLDYDYGDEDGAYDLGTVDSQPVAPTTEPGVVATTVEVLK